MRQKRTASGEQARAGRHVLNSRLRLSKRRNRSCLRLVEASCAGMVANRCPSGRAHRWRNAIGRGHDQSGDPAAGLHLASVPQGPPCCRKLPVEPRFGMLRIHNYADRPRHHACLPANPRAEKASCPGP